MTLPSLSVSLDVLTMPPSRSGKHHTTYYDSVTTGFVLEVRSTGTATYCLRYFDERGRQRQHKIGALGDITFDQARKAAKRLRSEVTLGGDPAAKKTEKKSVPTYAALAEQHLAFAKSYQKVPGNTEAVLRVHLLPRWGKLRLDEITSQAIATWFAEKHASGLAPATVEKIRITFNRSFELALKWGTAGLKANPVRGIPRRKFSNARERYLTATEAARLRTAVDASAISSCNFTIIYIYTNCPTIYPTTLGGLGWLVRYFFAPHGAVTIPHSHRGAGELLPCRNYRGESEESQGANHSEDTADSGDGARLLPERDHLHVTFPGYFGAPPLGGATEFENWASRGESLSLD